MAMKLLDKVSVDEGSVRRTDDGYLVAIARVGRANNIQIYTGDEMDRPEMPFVRVFRPASEVFSKDAMTSVAHKPMTNDHPVDGVSADTWKRDAIGQMGDEITKDGEFVRVPLVMMDGAAIKDYEAGKRELSLGYKADIEWSSGFTDSGEQYDAIQRNIRVNHIALVDQGRANQEFRIGDGANQWGARPTTRKAGGHKMADLQKAVIDGLTIDVTEQGAQAIEKLQKQLTDADKAKLDTQTTHDAAIAAKDAEIAKKQAEIDDLKGKVMDEAALDKRVQDRAELIGKAKLIVKDLDTTGVSDAGIRKATVAAKLGDAAIKDKSEAYIDARFDILTEDSETVTDSLRHIGGVKSTDGAGGWNDSAFKSAGVKMKKEA